jgi:aspartate/methionine/tyrosine aminotransferase
MQKFSAWRTIAAPAFAIGYISTWGTEELRSAIASTYKTLDSNDVLVFGGAQEAMFWIMQLFVGPGDHAIISVPNYQSMESVTIATGADVSGLALWEGEGSTLRWTLDVDRVRSLVRPNTRVIAVNFPNNPRALYRTMHRGRRSLRCVRNAEFGCTPTKSFVASNLIKRNESPKPPMRTSVAFR